MQFKKVIPKLRHQAIKEFEEGLKKKGIKKVSQKQAFANGFNACYKKLRSINKIRKCFHKKKKQEDE